MKVKKVRLEGYGWDPDDTECMYVLKIYTDSKLDDTILQDYIKYIEAYTPDWNLHRQIVEQEKMFDPVSCVVNPCPPEPEICGVISPMGHICQKPKGHAGKHFNFTDRVSWIAMGGIDVITGMVDKPTTEPVTDFCQHCGKEIIRKQGGLSWLHIDGSAWCKHDMKYMVAEPTESKTKSKSAPDPVPCTYCNMPIEWNSSDHVWRHKHNGNRFCNVNKLDKTAQPNEPLDFGLSKADIAGVKENERKASLGGITAKEAMENLSAGVNVMNEALHKTGMCINCGKEVTYAYGAWVHTETHSVSCRNQTYAEVKENKPTEHPIPEMNKNEAKGESIVKDALFFNDANGESVYLATFQNGKIVISDEFAEAIKAKMMPNEILCSVIDFNKSSQGLESQTPSVQVKQMPIAPCCICGEPSTGEMIVVSEAGAVYGCTKHAERLSKL